VPGALALTVAAKSEGNPAVLASASASLTIPDSTGLTASFTPATQTLPAPGMATFLLNVNNTGNTEDAYTAVITGSNGPVTATLMGLDGQPTQTIPVFRLPGLSTGAILLQANLADLGTGAVTVQVKSLDDHPLTSDNTVTVIAQAPPVTPTVQFAAATQSVNESAGTFTVTVPLSAAASQAVTVPFTLSGSAVAGVDYSGVTASPLVIAAGATSGTITGTLLPDAGASPTLTVTLGTPTNATLGATTSDTLTITEPPLSSTATVTSLILGSSPVYEFTPVTIVLNGSGFAPGATVTFDGATFTPDSITPTQISVAVTAADEGAFAVAVVNPGQAPVSAGSVPVQEEFIAGETRDANHLFISEALRDLMRHAPTLSDVNFYAGRLDQGLTRVQVIHLIEFEPVHHEFINLEINDAYERFYHRSAFDDPKAFSSWAPYLLGGPGTPSHTLEQLEATLVGLPEYQTDHPNDLLNAFFQDALGRPPSMIDMQQTQGLTPQQVATAVFSGAEFRQQLLNASYREYLDHGYTPSAANSVDLAFPAGTGSEDEIANILGEPTAQEFYNKTAG
jgi:hypothetical protein